MSKLNQLSLFFAACCVLFATTGAMAADKVVVIPLGGSKGSMSWTDGNGGVTATDQVKINGGSPGADKILRAQ